MSPPAQTRCGQRGDLVARPRGGRTGSTVGLAQRRALCPRNRPRNQPGKSPANPSRKSAKPSARRRTAAPASVADRPPGRKPTPGPATSLRSMAPPPAVQENAPHGTWVIDLDGVIWLTGEPIGDVGGRGGRVARRRRTDAVRHQQLGTHPGRAARSAWPTAASRPATTTFSARPTWRPKCSPWAPPPSCVADDGVREALATRGVTIVDHGPADAVIVGWTRSFTFDDIDRAAQAVRAGARLIGTNEDPTHPTPHGLSPGVRGPAGRRGHRGGDDARGGRQAASPDGRRHQGPGDRPRHDGGGPPLDRRGPGHAAGHPVRAGALRGDERATTCPPTRRPTRSPRTWPPWSARSSSQTGK